MPEGEEPHERPILLKLDGDEALLLFEWLLHRKEQAGLAWISTARNSPNLARVRGGPASTGSRRLTLVDPASTQPVISARAHA